MSDRKKADRAAEADNAQQAWIKPEVTRAAAGAAENVGPFGADGVIGSS